MRRYETIIITDPELSAENREPVLKRVNDVIDQGNGYLAFTDEWGARKLAYEIKKKERGYYIRFDYCGSGAVVDEMERFFRIDDRVMKYMTVLLDKAPDLEKIKEEMASAQQKAEASQKQPQTDETQPALESAEVSQKQPQTDETQPALESAEASESSTPEAPLASTQDPSGSEATAADDAQAPEPEAGESETAPTDTKEEIK